MTEASTTAETETNSGRAKIVERAGKAIDSAKESASSAVEKAGDRARKTAESAGENPLALLAGGVALGVLIGVLLPRHPKEKELVAPVGKRLADGAKAAVEAAKDSGKAELNQLLPAKDTARETVTHIVERAVGAAKEAATKTG
jgi:ElaB/YqjD/DUF883 family membrane-anchored ribosome-binding protein